MRVAPNSPCDCSSHVVRASSVEDELRDLRIDGYDVVFVNRVALLPAELDERSTPAGAARA